MFVGECGSKRELWDDWRYRISILYATFPLNDIPAHIAPVINVSNAIADPCINIETINVCSTGSGVGSDSVHSNTLMNTREAVWIERKKKT